jgi:RNA polymerase sigma-70 factor (ECF subfamily)
LSDAGAELGLIGAGDRDAFTRWLARAERPLRASLATFARRVDVEAVLQETLLRVWQVAPRVQPDGAPEPLLRLGVRIARNLALSELRRARLDPAELEVLERAAHAAAPPADREAGPADPLLRAHIARCCAALPPRPAAALEARLTAAGAEPDRVLADRLGMRLNTFLQNFGRARKLLLDCLRRQGVVVEV